MDTFNPLPKKCPTDTDPMIQTFRKQISDNDLKILEALNHRINLVKSLKDHKDAQGLTFYDATQEDAVLAQICQANHGPASETGLREIYAFLLDWTKREVVGRGSAKAE